MKPDVEEAIRRLTKAKPNVITRDQFGNDVSHLTVVERDDLRTLLDAYASREAEVKEAVRLMKPFAVPTLLSFVKDHEEVSRWPRAGDLRALSTYVTNHEASDGK